jgi:KDO2-lipid IV(A) lauroyltransferase
MSKVLFYILYAFTWVVSLIPFWILYRISDLTYLVLFYLIHYRKRTVLRNLKKSFPGKDQDEINLLAKRFYRHFCDFMVESIKGFTIPASRLDKRYRYVNLDVIHELGRKNRSIALVSGHYNNWEWMNSLPLKMEHEFLVIYRPLNNKSVDRITKSIRSRHGTQMYAMEHVYREAIQRRRDNKLFLIWFLADQRPPRSNEFWTSFLNQEASFFQGAEKLAKKLDLALVFMDVQKTKRGHYDVHFKLLIDHAADTGENEVTLLCVKEMEEEIRRQPEYWLWSHKRFKHKKPEDVKLIER